MSFQRLTAFLLAMVSLLFGGVGSVVGSTQQKPITATQRTYVFDRDKLLFGAWCFSRDDRFPALVRDFKEAGLQFFINNGTQYFTDEDLAWMDENGIGFFNGDSAFSRALTNKSAWGVVCRDEPTSGEYDALAQRVAQGYAEAPDRLPFINLLPMYASRKQLEEETPLRYATTSTYIDAFDADSQRYRMYLSDYIGKIDSDVISFDIYPLSVSKKTGKLGTYRYWLRNLDTVAEACRVSGRDLWVVTQASGNLLEGGAMRYCNNVEDQRWQNYVSLAFGAKAIIYACYYTGWWDSESHMIDDSGNRTATYDAVQKATKELAAFADIYTDYENHGAILYHGRDENAAGANLRLLPVPLRCRPLVNTQSPVLCGCFTKKDGGGKAYVLANMLEPQTGESAAVSLTFPGASHVTVYRKGVRSEYDNNKIEITLANREGVFITTE